MFMRAINFSLLVTIFIIISTKFSISEIVKKIEIIGNERIPNETVTMFSGIQIQDNITANDVNNVIKNLYETNFFSNISIELEQGILKIIVKENPIISDIRINGVKAKKIKDAIIKTLTLRQKSSFNEVVLIKEKEKIIKELKSQGYIFVKLSF